MAIPSFTGCAHRSDQRIFGQSFGGGMSKTQEIQVSRDAMKRWFPKGEQHCPFQNELFGMGGAGEPVKQSLQGETNQQHVVIFAVFDTALGPDASRPFQPCAPRQRTRPESHPRRVADRASAGVRRNTPIRCADAPARQRRLPRRCVRIPEAGRCCSSTSFTHKRPPKAKRDKVFELKLCD